MAKLTDLIKGDIDVVTRSEFDKSLRQIHADIHNNIVVLKDKAKSELKTIHEIIEDKFGIAESRMNSLANKISCLSTDLIRLETIMRTFVSTNNGRGENHE